MKFVCLGYIDQTKWESTPDSERNAFVDTCFVYDDVLRKGGHLLRGARQRSKRRHASVSKRQGHRH
jgi:hypothetical protein